MAEPTIRPTWEEPIVRPFHRKPDGFFKWEIVSADDPSRTSTFYTRDPESPGTSIMLLETEVNRLTFQRNSLIAGGLLAVGTLGLVLLLRRRRKRQAP